MIKSENGAITIKYSGELPDFLAEVTEINRAILDILKDALGEELACDLLDQVIRLTRMNENEIQEECDLLEKAAAVKDGQPVDRPIKLTVKDVIHLIELAEKAQKKGHYVGILFANYGSDVIVSFTRNGFNTNKNFDLYKTFNLTDESCDLGTFEDVLKFFTEVLHETAEEGEENAGN